MDRKRKIFLRIIATKTNKQIIASPLISPPGDLIKPDNHIFKKLIGFILVKKPELPVTAERESFFLKISKRKGLKRPSEITENKLESTLKPK